MKNYYIDRFITIYNKGQLQETQKAERWQVLSEEMGRAFIAAKQPRAIENKNGLSVYESFSMVIKEEGHYKRIIKEITPNGVIENV